jgi:hypothetical protein
LTIIRAHDIVAEIAFDPPTIDLQEQQKKSEGTARSWLLFAAAEAARSQDFRH